jgi:hypothetical protein
MGLIACVIASSFVITLLILFLGWAGRRRRAKSRGPVTLHCFRP